MVVRERIELPLTHGVNVPLSLSANGPLLMVYSVFKDRAGGGLKSKTPTSFVGVSRDTRWFAVRLLTPRGLIQIGRFQVRHR